MGRRGYGGVLRGAGWIGGWGSAVVGEAGLEGELGDVGFEDGDAAEGFGEEAGETQSGLAFGVEVASEDLEWVVVGVRHGGRVARVRGWSPWPGGGLAEGGWLGGGGVAGGDAL